MIVQNIIFPNNVCDEIGLYFRTENHWQIIQDTIELDENSVSNTYTYMNLFDVGFWKKYTSIEFWSAKVQVQGEGIIHLWRKTSKGHERISSMMVDTNKYEEVCFEFMSEEEDEEIIYFEFVSNKKMYIKGGCFCTRNQCLYRGIHLSVVICTYHRNQELRDTLNTLKSTRFFDEKSSLYGKLTIRVVDNASELPNDSHPFITVYHNPNTGGSGGFTRGIIETRNDEEKYGITNVVLMDDDVKIIPETFYRLYVFLSLVKDNYNQDVIAGRMFRLDDRKVQYTAAEIWNKGEIKHIGFQLDMSNMESLESINDSKDAEYSGWWFACFPMEFVRENTPLPFFIHCDDVEYGLRHGGTPIILNGIQVWHETYEYRQSPVMAYYDVRNPLIVNQIMMKYRIDKDVILEAWKEKISKEHLERDYLSERMMILGLWDFCNHNLKNIHRMNRRANKLADCPTTIDRFINSILWRITERYFKKLYEEGNNETISINHSSML